MNKDNQNKGLEEKLDSTVYLLQNLLALELYREGLSMQQIRQRLKINMNEVTAMLKGFGKRKE